MRQIITSIEIEDNHICAACIGEPFLRGEMQAQGAAARCTYCEREQPTISMGELAKRFRRVLADHYRKMDSISCDGNLLEDVVGSAAGIGSRPAEHVRLLLGGYTYRDGAVVPAMYERKGPAEYDLRGSWFFFVQRLKETRHFNRNICKLLDSVFEGLEERQTRDGKPVVVMAEPFIPPIFRARFFQSEDRLQHALARPELELGPPPHTIARAGRMNATGVPVFYGATHPLVAIAEVRPPVGSFVLVGRFHFFRPLRLLDIEALRQVYVEGSVFDPSYLLNLEKAAFLEQVSRHMSMPVMPDHEQSGYIISQAIADYLADHRELAIDGIFYRSVQSPTNGRNIVLFHKSSRVASSVRQDDEDDSRSVTLWLHPESLEVHCVREVTFQTEIVTRAR